MIGNDTPDRLAARLGVMAAAIAGDSGGLYQLVARLLDDGVPLDVILFDILIPTERDVGQRWQQGDVLISEEHAATATMETVVSLIAGSFDPSDNGPRIVIAAAEGDDHSLPGRLIAAHLLFLGYRTAYLGGNVKASDLAEYLQGEPADAVVLSCALPTHLIGARSSIQVSHHAGVPVVAGGNGFGPGGVWATPLGADVWVPTPRQVSETLESWNPDPATSEARAVDMTSDVAALINRRMRIVSSAQDHVAAGGNQYPDRETTDEIDHLLSAVGAAMFVGDSALLSAEIKWQQAMLAAHSRTDSDQIVEAMVAALELESPLAAEFMQATIRAKS